MFCYKLSCQPDESLSLVNNYSQEIERHCFQNPTFKSIIILPVDYRKCRLNEVLESGLLPSKLDIIDMPGDGFCLLHSLCLSLRSQFPGSRVLEIEELISLLKHEPISPKDVYLAALEYSLDTLRTGLYNYIYNRNYKTDFGDIVPFLLANSLGVDICILYSSEKLLKFRVGDCSKKHCQNVFLYTKSMSITMQLSLSRANLYKVVVHQNLQGGMMTLSLQLSRGPASRIIQVLRLK